jgi:hypothetical protein
LLIPIDPQAPAPALDLLAEGFPQRPRAFWQAALRRLHDEGDNARAGCPIGLLLVSKGVPVGVVLSPATLRTNAEGKPQRLINLSSWYLKPEHRWRAGLMFRAMMPDAQATYLDLTPTPEVTAMLPLMGFRAINVGTSVGVLPQLALAGGAGVRVEPWRAGDALPADAPSQSLLAAHGPWGCRSVWMVEGQERHLLVWQYVHVRRLPAARLLYVGSHRALPRHLPALARHLMLRGRVLLKWDARADEPALPGVLRRAGGVWHVRGPWSDDRTDFIGSELAMFRL